jgi:hypothetical protein
MLARRTKAKLVFGHDKETFFSFKHALGYYSYSNGKSYLAILALL